MERFEEEETASRSKACTLYHTHAYIEQIGQRALADSACINCAENHCQHFLTYLILSCKTSASLKDVMY